MESISKDSRHLEWFLKGVLYPAAKWQLLAWAEFNGASHTFLEVLHGMPHESYKCECQVAEAINSSEGASTVLAETFSPRLTASDTGLANRRLVS